MSSSRKKTGSYRKLDAGQVRISECHTNVISHGVLGIGMAIILASCGSAVDSKEAGDTGLATACSSIEAQALAELGAPGAIELKLAGLKKTRRISVTYCQILVSPGIGATLQVFFPLSVLITELFPTFG